MSTDRQNSPDEGETDDVHVGYRAVVERYENKPDQCTIYPADASSEVQMVTWMTARGDAFVDIEDML